MIRTFATLSLAAIMAASLTSLVAPARAQIGNIFSDRPRPPAGVPQADPMPDEEEDVPDLPPQGRILPTPNRPQPAPPPGRGAPPPDAVQNMPLPPPLGIPPSAPQPGQPAPNVANNPPVNTLPGLPPGQRQPRGGTPSAPPTTTPPTPATLQPGDEVVTEPPAQKIINKQAAFAGLDKITGRIIKFDADVGETVQFGALRIKTDAWLHAAGDGSCQHRRFRRGR